MLAFIKEISIVSVLSWPGQMIEDSTCCINASINRYKRHALELDAALLPGSATIGLLAQLMTE